MKILKAVIAHKDFEWKDLSEDELKNYLVFTPNEIKTNLPNVIKFNEGKYDNRLYSEFSHLNYIRHNVEFDWITISHYRRRFEYKPYYTIPASIKYDANNYEQYKLYHNINDLDLMDYIVFKNLNKSWYEVWKEMLEDNYFIPYNICNVSADIFKEWIDISRTLLDQYSRLLGLNSYDKVKKRIKENLADYSNKDIDYQSRVFGYLWERITNMYWRMYIKNHNNLPNINNPITQEKVVLLEQNQEI